MTAENKQTNFLKPLKHSTKTKNVRQAANHFDGGELANQFFRTTNVFHEDESYRQATNHFDSGERANQFFRTTNVFHEDETIRQATNYFVGRERAKQFLKTANVLKTKTIRQAPAILTAENWQTDFLKPPKFSHEDKNYSAGNQPF